MRSTGSKRLIARASFSDFYRFSVVEGVAVVVNGTVPKAQSLRGDVGRFMQLVTQQNGDAIFALRLRFGRFLNSTTNVVNPAASGLTAIPPSSAFFPQPVQMILGARTCRDARTKKSVITLARLDRERTHFVTPRPQIRERFCTSSIGWRY